MAKEIILYNLKDSVTDEEYKKYCDEDKGPFLNSLPSCKKFTLVKIVASKKGEIPYKYVGIVDATSSADWQKDTQTEGFQKFRESAGHPQDLAIQIGTGETHTFDLRQGWWFNGLSIVTALPILVTQIPFLLRVLLQHECFFFGSETES